MTDLSMEEQYMRSLRHFVREGNEDIFINRFVLEMIAWGMLVSHVVGRLLRREYEKVIGTKKERLDAAVAIKRKQKNDEIRAVPADYPPLPETETKGNNRMLRGDYLITAGDRLRGVSSYTDRLRPTLSQKG